MAVKIEIKDNLNRNSGYIKPQQTATQDNVVNTIIEYNRQVGKEYYDKEQILKDENALQSSLNYLANLLTRNFETNKSFRTSADTDIFDGKAATDGFKIEELTLDGNSFSSAGILQKIDTLAHLISGTTGGEDWESTATGNVVGSTNSTKTNSPVVGLVKPTADTYNYGIDNSSNNIKVIGLETNEKETLLSETQVAAMVSAAVEHVYGQYNDKLVSIISYLLYTTKGLSDSFRWVLTNGDLAGITEAPLYVKGWNANEGAFELVKANFNVGENGQEKSDSIYYYTPSTKKTSLNGTSYFEAETSADGKVITINYTPIPDSRATVNTYTINVPTYTVEFDVGEDNLKFIELKLGGDNGTQCFNLNSDGSNEIISNGNKVSKAILPVGSKFMVGVRSTVKCFYITDISNAPDTTRSAYAATNDGNNKSIIKNYGLKNYSNNNEKASTFDDNYFLQADMLFTCYQIPVSLYEDDTCEKQLKETIFVDENSSYKMSLDETPKKLNCTIKDVSSGASFNHITNTVTINTVSRLSGSELKIWFNWTVNSGSLCLKYNYDDCPSDIIIGGNEGQTITLPQNLTRDGYSFTGWYETPATDKSNKVESITLSGSEGTTLYAGWSENAYSINYILNGGNMNESETVSVNFGSNITVPTPEKVGYIFNGWNTSPNFKGVSINGNVAISGSMTLYAEWKPITYEIVYDLNDNEINNKTGEVTNFDFEAFRYVSPNNLPFALGHPENTGYVFTGWKDKNNSPIDVITSENIDSIVDENEIHLFASWVPKKVNYSIEIYVHLNSSGIPDNKDNLDLYYAYQNITSIAKKDGTSYTGNITDAKVGDTIDIGIINKLIDKKSIALPSGFEMKSVSPIVLSGNKENVVKVINATITYNVYYHNVTYFNENIKNLIGHSSNNLGEQEKYVKQFVYSTNAIDLPKIDNKKDVDSRFTFQGWVDKEGYDVTTIPAFTTSDVHYYAKWTQNLPEKTTDFVSLTCNPYGSTDKTITSNLSVKGLYTTQSISYKLPEETIWANLSSIDISLADAKYSGINDFNDIGKAAKQVELKLNSIKLDAPEGRSLSISEVQLKPMDIKFAAKPINIFYVAENKDYNSNNIPKSDCAIWVNPVDTKGVNDDELDNAEIEVRCNYGYIDFRYEDSSNKEPIVKGESIQIDNATTILAKFLDSPRYEASNNDTRISIKSKSSQKEPFNDLYKNKLQNALRVNDTLGSCITNTMVTKGLGQNGVTGGGSLLVKKSGASAWNIYKDDIYKASDSAQTLVFKYRTSDLFDESSEVTKTFNVKDITLNVNSGATNATFNNNNIIISGNSNYYTGSLSANGRTEASINLIGNQSITFNIDSVSRTGYNLKGFKKSGSDVYATTEAIDIGTNVRTAEAVTFAVDWTAKESDKYETAMFIKTDKDVYTSDINYSYVDNKAVFDEDVTIKISKDSIKLSNIIALGINGLDNELSMVDDKKYLKVEPTVYYTNGSSYDATNQTIGTSLTFNNSNTTPGTNSINESDGTVFPYTFGYKFTTTNTTASISEHTYKAMSFAWVNVNGTAKFSFTISKGTSTCYTHYKVDKDNKTITFYPYKISDDASPINISTTQNFVVTTELEDEPTLIFRPTLNEKDFSYTVKGQSISINNATETDEDNIYSKNGTNTITPQNGWSGESTN